MWCFELIARLFLSLSLLFLSLQVIHLKLVSRHLSKLSATFASSFSHTHSSTDNCWYIVIIPTIMPFHFGNKIKNKNRWMEISAEFILSLSLTFILDALQLFNLCAALPPSLVFCTLKAQTELLTPPFAHPTSSIVFQCKC